MANLDDLFREIEDAPPPAPATPEEIAKRAARVEAEFAKGVRNGWHDAEGNSLLPGGADEDEPEPEDE